jgi:hypothetical protein
MNSLRGYVQNRYGFHCPSLLDVEPDPYYACVEKSTWNAHSYLFSAYRRNVEKEGIEFVMLILACLWVSTLLILDSLFSGKSSTQIDKSCNHSGKIIRRRLHQQMNTIVFEFWNL